MTSQDLLRIYHHSLRSLRELRIRAGYRNPKLKDGPALRGDARRLSRRLAVAPDEETAELTLLSDHAGSQAFWYLAATHWETMELLLLPAAFELVPDPLPYEVLAYCMDLLIETEPLETANSENFPSYEPTGTFKEASTSYCSLELSPWMGDGKAGAVWQFSDVY